MLPRYVNSNNIIVAAHPIPDNASISFLPRSSVTNRLEAPVGYVPGTEVAMTWKLDNIKDGDQILVIFYDEINHVMKYIPCTVNNGQISFTTTCYGNCSIVKLTK